MWKKGSFTRSRALLKRPVNSGACATKIKMQQGVVFAPFLSDFARISATKMVSFSHSKINQKTIIK
jgi:hypothetical protein